MKGGRHTADVIGTAIDVLDWGSALARLTTWAHARQSRVVCICNVHSVVTARQDADFAQVLAAADMCTPDGAPVAWMLRRLGHAGQPRINGPDLMWRWCAQVSAHAKATGVPAPAIYLYGGTPDTLARLQERLRTAFPALRQAGAWSPPFRALTAAEDAAAVAAINASGAGLVWVGLGCPRQEQWMHAHRSAVQGVMVGVGAAFDYHAGTVRRAPVWAQRAGLEWLYRLASEPRRLWRRYLVTNSVFIAAALRQLWTHAAQR